MENELIVIGASWGGLHAVGTVLTGLGDAAGAGVVVAQHRGPGCPAPGRWRDCF